MWKFKRERERVGANADRFVGVGEEGGGIPVMYTHFLGAVPEKWGRGFQRMVACVLNVRANWRQVTSYKRLFEML